MPTFKIEKTKDFTIMANHHFRDKRLSFKAVGLLSFMLSVPENWDFSASGLEKVHKDGKDSIGSALKELEIYGYLDRLTIRDENGRFVDIEYNIYEVPRIEKPVETVDNFEPISDKPSAGEPQSGNPSTAKPPPENHKQINKNQSKTKKVRTNITNTDLNKNQSNQSESVENDMIEKIDLTQCERKIKENIDYLCLCQRYGKTRADEIVELMLGIMYSAKKTIRISSNEYPADYIKNRIMKLNYDNIEYMFNNLDKTTTKITNIYEYKKAVLLNTLATTDSYYRAEANHDINNILYP